MRHYQETAQIYITYGRSESGVVPVSATWSGPPLAPVWCEDYQAHALDCLPFRVKRIKPWVPSPWECIDGEYYARDFPFLGFYYWLMFRWSCHCRYFDAFSDRLILTCHVWGLGWTDRGEYPGWGNIARPKSIPATNH